MANNRVGQSVLFVDSVGNTHNAIVTADWAYGDTPGSVNLVYVSDDEALTDPYGRQIVRKTSVVHQQSQAAPGMYWKEA